LKREKRDRQTDRQTERERWTYLALAVEDGGGFFFSHDVTAIVKGRDILLEPFCNLCLPVGREEMVQRVVLVW
jgi:hypothetical protein